MVRDPVCGMDIDEINVPESPQAEPEGRMYYFCSPSANLSSTRILESSLQQAMQELKISAQHEQMHLHKQKARAR